MAQAAAITAGVTAAVRIISTTIFDIVQADADRRERFARELVAQLGKELPGYSAIACAVGHSITGGGEGGGRGFQGKPYVNGGRKEGSAPGGQALLAKLRARLGLPKPSRAQLCPP